MACQLYKHPLGPAHDRHRPLCSIAHGPNPHRQRPHSFVQLDALPLTANGKIDRALFGIPKEGVGFSNDAPIRLGPPKWKDAQFQLGDDKVITFKLRYFIGGGAKN